MFRPPRCPYLSCPNHLQSGPLSFRSHGSYRALCRPHPIPRFRCSGCLRTFSRQTFRMDYRDHRPDLNARLFQYLASGLGLRQSSRNLRLSLRCTELKFRKIARHLRRLNLNLRSPLRDTARFHFDELETYEEQRNTRPLSVALLVASDSRYIVWAQSAPIRPRGKMTEQRREALEKAEKQHGVRRDLSLSNAARTFARGTDMTRDLHAITLETDEKSTYPALARRAFGEERLVHHRTSSELVRTTWNPLFPINHEEALMRDLMGRMRRESWLVSKRRRYLDLGLQLHLAYRNLVRRRFNHDEASPAQHLGFVSRRLTPEEVLSWRQEHGRRSVHPLSKRGTGIERWQVRAALAA